MLFWLLMITSKSFDSIDDSGSESFCYALLAYRYACIECSEKCAVALEIDVYRGSKQRFIKSKLAIYSP